MPSPRQANVAPHNLGLTAARKIAATRSLAVAGVQTGARTPPNAYSFPAGVRGDQT